MKIGFIGATNVGKSTLFNVLLGTHRAIVTGVHGTTRDILYDQFDHPKLGSVTLVDSPGLDTFDEEIPFLEQVIALADVLLFVIDAGVGFGPKEEEIYALLNKAGKKQQTILLVNKLEGALNKGMGVMSVADYYGRGFVDVLPVSGKQRLGLYDVWDALADFAKTPAEAGELSADEDGISADVAVVEEGVIPLAIVGRPNAGKSTLLNTLLGEDRALVSDVPGTTLDYNVGEFVYEGQRYRLYDTAGIKRKGKMHGLEKIAYEKTKTMLQYIKPVVVYVVDGDAGMVHRDMSLLGEMVDFGLPILVCCNKVDLLSSSVSKKKIDQMAVFLQFAKHIPIVPLSGQSGQGVSKLFSFVQGVWGEYTKRIATSSLNEIVRKAWLAAPPMFPKNKICRISYVTQVETKPPRFMVSVNNKKLANFSFKRWLENVIRREFGFVGVTMQFFWRNKREERKYDR